MQRHFQEKRNSLNQIIDQPHNMQCFCFSKVFKKQALLYLISFPHFLVDQTDEHGVAERQRERVNLRFDGAVEIIEKQEMEEIREGEALLRVVTPMQNLLYEAVRIGRGAAHLSLVLHQEPTELID